ncbi:MAG: cell division protein FtsJ, partial [Chloroflexota bacterium]|nr:cell division protein FtsJ [Chloroflexota bacterium]
MIDAAQHLRPGGMLIVTLKLTHHAAIRTIRNATDRLAEVVDIRFVRQLHHNRNEVTVVGIRPDA